ncbi:MAG: hypothetical protein L6R41_006367 [Letrouitia leprolyta]|nr:MAG: hypothetical protein L6R41_006367 [Letrouitia leprolyta]
MASATHLSLAPGIISLPPMSPPPTAPLPALPLQATAPAPPPTPRNASQLYGEFSWPSLDVATLLSRLEDVAESRDSKESDDFFAPDHTIPAIGYSETRCSLAGESTYEDDLPVDDFLGARSNDMDMACLGEGVSVLPPPYGVSQHSEGGGDAENACSDVDSGSEDIYHTCSEGEDTLKSELDHADPEADDESGFVGSKDWADLLRMLGWLVVFDGDAQEQLLELNERGKEEKRWGACVDDGHEA